MAYENISLNITRARKKSKPFLTSFDTRLVTSSRNHDDAISMPLVAWAQVQLLSEWFVNLRRTCRRIGVARVQKMWRKVAGSTLLSDVGQREGGKVVGKQHDLVESGM